ncbi:hypothetical protein JOM56_003050 [Amanita muscaria]|uniref:Uncharacterized protein n=1 Tax=Amanita muscaria (strain Koide BX008) TaxID=946122 RepID=A0A0C2SUA3_AMAMK|nr:hypothetical protein M378DRAFT_159909 [Amanita muscaria Koide BX008]
METPPPSLAPPRWVFNRIIAAGGDIGPRYEASLYGPTNSLLTSYFPIIREFMVKPQGKIRPEFVNDIDPNVRASFDSYHAEVLPRVFQGSELGVKIPDFIVVKATESKDNDKVLLLVEIKPADRLVQYAVEQLAGYLEAFANKFHQETEEPLFDVIYGLLVVGRQVQLLTLPINGELGLSGLLDVKSARLDAFLRTIAVNNW